MAMDKVTYCPNRKSVSWGPNNGCNLLWRWCTQYTSFSCCLPVFERKPVVLPATLQQAYRPNVDDWWVGHGYFEVYVKLVPCMLSGVQIWRIQLPIHPVEIVLPKKVCNNSCTMRSGIVILKHGHRTNMLEGRYAKGLDNLLQIAISVQVTINDIKRSPIIEWKGIPNHDTATTKRQTLTDVDISKSLSRTPVHTFSVVAKLQGEPRPVREENWCPLGTLQADMTCAPVSSGCWVTLKKGWTNYWSMWTKVFSPESVSCFDKVPSCWGTGLLAEWLIGVFQNVVN